MVFIEGDQVVDQPLPHVPTMGLCGNGLRRSVWTAALGYAALRGEIGSAAFLAGQGDYVARRRGRIIVPRPRITESSWTSDLRKPTYWCGFLGSRI